MAQYYDNHYGLKPMTLEEELNASDNVKSTRRRKIEAIDNISRIRNLLDSIEHTVKTIPELDDGRHAELVDDLATFVLSATRAVERVIFFKGRW